MTVELNHTIIWCRDKQVSSSFLADVLGLQPPTDLYHFKVVKVDNRVSLDFMEKDGPVSPQHYAFLIDDGSFDQIMMRIEARGLDYWADPAREKPRAINRLGGGRGVYFQDPDGHLLEVLTRPYQAAAV